MRSETESAFGIERRDEGAVLWFDVPDSSVNVLRPAIEDDLHSAFDELEAEASEVVVITSAKKGSFCVGADVDMLSNRDDSTELASLSRAAQAVMDRIDRFPGTTVAAINGTCLGGGLELALACDHRVAADSTSTVLGQPEIQLGMIPGAGGTVRLPLLVGIENALDMILAGRRLRVDEALRMGLVDEVVHPAILLEAAFQRARMSRADVTVLNRARSFALTGNPLGRRLVFSRAREQVMKRTHGNMPAPLRAIEVVREGVESGISAGLEAEAKAFGELATTPEAAALIHLFRAKERVKDRVAGTPRPVNKVGVIGAGLMGSGIAAITVADAGVPVRITDLDWGSIGSGMRAIGREVERRGYLRPPERKKILARALPTTGTSGFSSVDAVIEAVVEDLEVKREILADMESLIDPETLFATNTSSIPIAEIAEKAKHPGRVLGMHYFSPVPQIPLLEVIEGPLTQPDAVATAVELGSRQGKTVIVVGDGPGFYTSRILAPYVDEAARLLAEGAAVDAIDRLMTRAGFPVGPFRLLDEVGLDIAFEIAHILLRGLGERMEPSPLLEKMISAGRIGRKAGSGFYAYDRSNGGWERRDEVDEKVYEVIGVVPTKTLSSDAHDRMLLRMVNEAVLALGDGIVRTASDGDIGAVFGLGFPAHLGGPFHYLERLGSPQAVERLESLSQRHGPRFRPAPLLMESAGSGEGFGSGESR